MNTRERLYTIPDLALNRRLPLMSARQVESYADRLQAFVEAFPDIEAAMKAALAVNDIPSVLRHLAGIRETLVSLYADELAEGCWKQMNNFRDERPERIEAYALFLLSMLAALSIDIQVAFLRDVKSAAEAFIDPTVEALSEQPETVKSILAVDDDPYFLDTFKATLKDTPCKVIGVTSGASALHMLTKFQPDLFVLDIDMPGMDGVALAYEIRAQGQDAPIVFITGNATREYVIKCVHAGAADFIIKPIVPQNTVGRISRFLDIPEAQQQGMQ